MGFEESAEEYVSAPQRARVWTEAWVHHWLYCPNCGAERLDKLPNNAPVADFNCSQCAETYELKSKNGAFGTRVVDGALATMQARVLSDANPNLILLSYDKKRLSVDNVLIVPRQFFTPSVIEPRKPLAKTARRAGWTGCNIILSGIPPSGRIEIVRDGSPRPRAEVLEEWRSTQFLRNLGQPARGWLLEVLSIVEALPSETFSLADVYACEARLHAAFPMNNNVRPKIRQQLQVLRDNGVIEFLGGGAYRKLRAPPSA